MPFITAKNLHSVVTTDENNIWMVGQFGTILHSEDGGKTFTPQDAGTKDDLLTEICFVNNKIGWVCGIMGIMLHTDDGGKTWVKQDTGTKAHLFSVHFADLNNGWAVGDVSTIIHTTDGGKTWGPQVREPLEDEYAEPILNAVWGRTPKVAFIAGEFGTILRTFDGGENWEYIDSDDLVPPMDEEGWEMPKPACYDVVMIDENKGFMSGIDGIILRTLDAGATWKAVPSNTDLAIYSITFKGNRGWGVGSKGNYIRSEDGGATWQPVLDEIKTRFWLNDVAFATVDKGWVIGARGGVFETDDGGKTFTWRSGITYAMPELKMPTG
jgi:photosystem II stability/assembly factor-like uncharacterized protein